MANQAATSGGIETAEPGPAGLPLLDGITRALRKGDPITFVGFGTFKTAQRRARLARNPRTGDAIKIPKRRVVRFTPGKALKIAVR